ncbi:uncharacterized protein EI97DRAFT_35441 [Westerdykella ornata]|uniref:Uncharacterized protein n=1 Tax=Westerdykella ornata TaxID=318751 RepID=A0A6A6JIQ9_WESOR|nr:uncharacterized protein EI97DRAFT_35441 [Westerdykella ornata]KAF2276322.1 hypothetical protein EI97DRAFT_35441 [Westerdykella ornata]
MPCLYRLACLALPLISTLAAAEPASQTKNEAKPIYADAQEAFRDLLNALPEESLHVALNSLAPYREGVFESNRHGVERVHHDDPPLATKLIIAAVQDLKKRQTPSNGTTPNPPQSSQQQPSTQAPPPPPSSSQAPPILVPVPITSTDDRGRTTVVSSEILSEPTASAVVTTTRVNDQGATEIATETKPAVVLTSTDAAGSVVTTTSAVDFAPTPGQQLTRTDSRGNTFVTTYTPGAGTVSSVKLITTTGADGKPSVITSYTFVNPGAPTGEGGSPAGTASGKPGLQTGAAVAMGRNGAVEAAVVGGAVVGWLGMWL